VAARLERRDTVRCWSHEPTNFENPVLMSAARQFARFATLALAVLCGVARAWAVPIFEPNNTIATATILDPGTFVVNDSLDGASGRPNTLLAHTDPVFGARFEVDDNSSPLGNGFASQLVGIPLELGGGAYFQVTGAQDVNFTGAHSQVGGYYVQFDLYKSDGSFFKTLPLKYESVEANTIDNVWFNPPAVPEPERVGGTVNVTLQNIVGPGSSDSLDFFLFSGLQPNQPFSVSLAANGFSPLLGQFGNSNNLLQSMGGANPVLSGVADGQGKVRLAVTGADDTQFFGQHVGAGTYSLVLSPISVPEPQSLALAAVGAAMAGWMRRRRGQRAR